MNSRVNANLLAGTFFACAGVFGVLTNRADKVGSLFQMGSAFLPFALSLALIGIGAMLVVQGLLVPGIRLRLMTARPPVMITLAILAFAIAVRWAGLAPAVFLTVVVAACALDRPRIGEAAIVGLALALGCSAVFVWGLGLPMPVIGR